MVIVVAENVGELQEVKVVVIVVVLLDDEDNKGERVQVHSISTVEVANAVASRGSILECSKTGLKANSLVCG